MEELTLEEVEKFLNYISSEKVYVYIDNMLFGFKFPNSDLKQKSDLIYKRAYEKAVSEGALPLKELKNVVNSRNIISVSETTKLKKLKSQLAAQEVLLSKTTRVKANQDRIKTAIQRIKSEIYVIENKINSKLTMSAENYAEEVKSFFVCSRCVYDEEGHLFWKTYEDSLKDKRIELAQKIFYEYIKFYRGLPVKTIRIIARSSLWRIKYNNSVKTSDPLFGIPVTEYSNNQFNLVYWSSYYSNIYEMLPEHRPSDLIIDDDDALDAYMKSFWEERNKDDAVRRSKVKRPGKLSAFDSEEVIVTRSHELYQDIKYDKPKEAEKIKDRADIKKRTKRG